MTKSEKIEIVKRMIQKGFLFEGCVACHELGIDFEDVRKELGNDKKDNRQSV